LMTKLHKAPAARRINNALLELLNKTSHHPDQSRHAASV
jgi:hypothetical protein